MPFPHTWDCSDKRPFCLHCHLALIIWNRNGERVSFLWSFSGEQSTPLGTANYYSRWPPMPRRVLQPLPNLWNLYHSMRVTMHSMVLQIYMKVYYNIWWLFFNSWLTIMEIEPFLFNLLSIWASRIPQTHSSGTAVPVQCLKYMPALTRQKAGSMAKMEEFAMSMLAALEDPAER